MSSQREDSIPHELRTAAEPRQNRLYPVRLSHVEQVNPSVRLLQLTIPPEGDNVSLCPFNLGVLPWRELNGWFQVLSFNRGYVNIIEESSIVQDI